MESARSFKPRAPRYEYQDIDPKTLRFSRGNNSPLDAFVFNLSLTGLAFYVHKSKVPQLSENIKVELTLPQSPQSENSQKIAWFGKVVRIDRKKNAPWWIPGSKSSEKFEYFMVGIRFIDLPAQHAQQIQKTLDECWAELRRKRWQEHWKAALAFYSKKTVWALGYLTLCWLVFLFFEYFTQPSDSYDGEKGSPWGKRFKINSLFDK